MSLLCDADLEEYLKSGKIGIEGWKIEHINPSSVDLCLGSTFRKLRNSNVTHVDPKNMTDHESRHVHYDVPEGESYILHPNKFVLGITEEYVRVPADLAARLDGKSSWGRLGVVVHSTAGTVAAGFEGKLTLEIANLSNVPVCLWPGMRICQLSFETLTRPAARPYNLRADAKYNKQQGPDASKMHLEHQKSAE